ncbi:hypothetical protein XELAEV_18010842mg [Xenopus laevis]|uniref:Uncharacterized protein n=1 Tax=Xenopus laevis TaxID=8355 RepID=A0A974DXI1_XENLA|nr:hypothetical protein XELAEV_18010842mg [Xenopus laevis]
MTASPFLMSRPCKHTVPLWALFSMAQRELSGSILELAEKQNMRQSSVVYVVLNICLTMTLCSVIYLATTDPVYRVCLVLVSVETWILLYTVCAMPTFFNLWGGVLTTNAFL